MSVLDNTSTKKRFLIRREILPLEIKQIANNFPILNQKDTQ
jgi:hypothetical protein